MKSDTRKDKTVAPDAGDDGAVALPADRPRKTLGVKAPAGSGEARPAPSTAGKGGVRTRFQSATERRSTGARAPEPAQRSGSEKPAMPRPETRQAPRATQRSDSRPAQPAVRDAKPVRTRAEDRSGSGNAPPPAASGDAEARQGVRLSKVMADRGMCSRREADTIIERGWVFVNGERVSELGIRIDPNAEVVLAGPAKQHQAAQVTILLHKPIGYVSGQPEPGYEPAVKLIGPDTQFDSETAERFHPSHLKGLAPAGRLDIDSTGLLVMTQDGRVARQLIGDHSKVEKEYLVRVEGSLDAQGLALLNHGLELDGRKLRPAKVEWLNEDQLRFILREGRKRQIRRMCELVGLRVAGLKRVRIGCIKLGDLPPGQWRFLREDEGF